MKAMKRRLCFRGVGELPSNEINRKFSIYILTKTIKKKKTSTRQDKKGSREQKKNSRIKKMERKSSQLGRRRGTSLCDGVGRLWLGGRAGRDISRRRVGRENALDTRDKGLFLGFSSFSGCKNVSVTSTADRGRRHGRVFWGDAASRTVDILELASDFGIVVTAHVSSTATASGVNFGLDLGNS